MIAKMKTITVIGLNSDRKEVMELLQKSSSVEFTETEKDDGLNSIDVSDRIMQFERYLTATEQALSILEEFVPKKTGLFSVRKPASSAKYSMKPDEAKTMGDLVLKIINAQKKMVENKAEIGRLNGKIAAIMPWKALDVPSNFGGTDKTETALYFLPGEHNEQEISEILGDTESKLYYEIVSADKDATRVFFLFLKKDKEDAERALRESGFIPPTFGLSSKTPNKKISQIKETIKELENDIKQQQAFILNSAKRREEIELFYDHLVLRRDKYQDLEKLKKTDTTFILNGYVPEYRASHIEKLLTKHTSAYVEFGDIPDDEEAPVLFRNNGFSKPVEGITSTYSMPGKTDIDPNGIMAFFYYLFFGMMFSDAGYGLLLALGAGYLGFFAKAEASTKNSMRMFCYCGISTTFWGFMYGSFFGNAIPVVGNLFFGADWVLKPIWLDPVQEPLMLLIFSIGIGLLQIIIGLILKFYVLWRSGEKLSALFDVGFWLLVLTGISVLALGLVTGGIVTTIGTYMAITGAVGLVLTQGRSSKNIIGKLFGGILSLYDITSYVSDALSYSRLMALGLATGVIAQVINTMGSLAGGGPVGAILFIVVFVAGHAMNFAINCLGAYVHTNRLQYVEFFSKFYEGGGRAFTPLKMNTKYFEFTEE
ncbi:MAG: V-type ATP synthase subunit I [Clostridia bacterium]|nr:V-type ATP synthase subunit I [Clostridia bacterium]